MAAGLGALMAAPLTAGPAVSGVPAVHSSQQSRQALAVDLPSTLAIGSHHRLSRRTVTGLPAKYRALTNGVCAVSRQPSWTVKGKQPGRCVLVISSRRAKARATLQVVRRPGRGATGTVPSGQGATDQPAPSSSTVGTPSASPSSTPAPSTTPATGVTSPDPVPSASPTDTPPVGAVKPDASNTGVPAGTELTDVYPAGGTLTITTAGTVIDRQRIHGFVIVKAPNVTIRRSAIIGPDNPVTLNADTALLKNTSGLGTNLVVQDTTIAPTNPHVRLNGVFGWDFTLTRVDISKGNDNVMIYGNNATIQASWLHNNTQFASDPNQGGGASHNDGVQVQGGSKIRIIGNTINGARNSALMLTQDYSATSDTWFNNNWADNGWCSVNIAKKARPYMTGLQANNNKFGRNTTFTGSTTLCSIIYVNTDSDLTPTGNTYEDTGTPAQLRKG